MPHFLKIIFLYGGMCSISVKEQTQYSTPTSRKRHTSISKVRLNVLRPYCTLLSGNKCTVLAYLSGKINWAFLVIVCPVAVCMSVFKPFSFSTSYPELYQFQQKLKTILR